jgi:hypothetical protein
MSVSLADKAAMGRTWDPKLVCGITFVLVFLTGAAAGALFMDFGLHRNMRQPSFDTPAGKVRYFERLQKDLDLTPTQSEQMQSVLNDFWKYYRTVLSDSKDKIDQILTEEQRRKFDQRLQNEAQR